MLTLTDTAAGVVKQLTEIDETSGPDGGLRISTQPESDEGPALVLSAVPAPEDGDQVLDEAGARVFLDESAALMLDDKVLDAQIGSDGSVQFAVGTQD
ncbi:MAG: Fe-S cluster assembly protein HesB [Aeromicrobium sp.]|uniref:Fe-S cluster assembly protein HesB n=1 Tax=Aeromicrobium sp. TaxID=1871063 RepID=UPI003C5B9DAA